MEEIVGLSGKERARLVELELVKAGRQTLGAVAERLRLSRRQVRRIWQRFKRRGAKGLVHEGRGRASNRAFDADKRRRSLEIYQTRLEGFGPTLAAEKLAEAGIEIDHETLRRWLIGEGLWRKQKKRGPHRKWRPPKEHFGELVQMDGSFHDWLGTGSQPCLIDLVDDATGRMSGVFQEQETTEGCMKALWGWIELYGIPRALYTDNKNVYVTPREPTREEQLAGQPALTVFGLSCHKLGIKIIPASSPQAKGRVERRHGVLQDRFVKELRLEGIQDLASAHELFVNRFVKTINEKFAHSPASAIDYHRPVPKGLRLEDVFVFDEQRIVQNDWTIAWDGRWFQITGPKARLPRRRERITVRRRLDDSRVLLHRDRPLEFRELTERPRRSAPLAESPSSNQTPRPAWVPPPKHPWRLQGEREGRLRLLRKPQIQPHPGLDP
jgi:transposase